MSKKKRRKTSDLLDVLGDRHFATPEAQAELEEARASAQVARQIRALRLEAVLTQRELAERIGTKHPVIRRRLRGTLALHAPPDRQGSRKAVEIRFVSDPECRSA